MKVKNRYFANLVLCQEYEEYFTTVEGIYDAIKLNPEDNVELNIILFLNSMIDEEEEITFFFVLKYLGNDEEPFLPLLKRCAKMQEGLFVESSVVKTGEVEFIGEGKYAIELYVRAGNDIDIEVDPEEFSKKMHESELLTRYLIDVKYDTNL